MTLSVPAKFQPDSALTEYPGSADEESSPITEDFAVPLSRVLKFVFKHFQGRSEQEVGQPLSFMRLSSPVPTVHRQSHVITSEITRWTNFFCATTEKRCNATQAG